MPQPNRQKAIPPARPRSQWTVILVTVLIGMLATWLAWPQVFPGPGQADETTLPNLNQRASNLEQVTNLIQRDSYCVPLSAYGRELDHALAPDARVFLSGMIGEANGPKLGYYFFLRNYLFPREVRISMDTNIVFHETGWFNGTPCDSPEELQTNGFDLLLRMPTNSNNIEIIPLTQKGVPK
jgi:hypothetical protein